MLIANPMYDAVFKHLLEDRAVARLIVGTILDEEIEELELAPQEMTVQARPPPGSARPADLTVQRIDFAATVRTVGGESLRVLIEVQKSHFSDDVLRFRRYLGQHYADERSYVTVRERGAERRRPLPLLTIYFLGRRLPNTDATVLKVTRQYLDAVTGERLPVREDFVEALTHDCYVIQIPRITDRRRNDLEKLLGVFDQDRCTDDRHMLDLDDAEFPRHYSPVLRRLQSAAADNDIVNLMAFEDEVVGEWSELLRSIAERDETIAERDATIAGHEETIAGRDATIAEHEEALRRQQAEIDALRRRVAGGSS